MKRKRTSLFLLLALLLALTVALIYLLGFRQGVSTATAPKPTLVFGDVPAKYCPTVASMIVTQLVKSQEKILLDQSVAVTGCHVVDFPSIIGQTGSFKLYLKVPGALAFSLTLSGRPESVIEQPLRLGDVNNDNVIDKLDQQLIQAALKTKTATPGTDVDGDGQVSVLDLSQATLHEGVGVDRPDGKKWKTSR